MNNKIRNKLEIIFQKELRKSSLIYRLVKHGRGDKYTIHHVLDLSNYKAERQYYQQEAQKGISWQDDTIIFGGKVVFESENLDLVKAMYIKTKDYKEKNAILEILVKKFMEYNSDEYLAKFTFFAMAKVFSLESAIDMLDRLLVISKNHADAIIGITEFIRFEPEEFNDKLINKFKFILDNKWEKWNKAYNNPGYSVFQYIIPIIYDQINEIQFKYLEQELLEDVNFEINQDYEKVKDSIKKYGFDTELSEFLENLQQEFNKAKDVFDFKTCIDKSRTFQEHLFRSIVDKIEKEKGIAFNGNRKKITQYFDYLKRSSVGFIKDEEYDFICKLYGFASNEGTHSLSANYSGARIIKNIIIELALFLLDRLNKYI